MNTEPHDPSRLPKLFAAARQELPAPEVRERVLGEMLDVHRARPQNRRSLSWVAVPVLAAAAAVALWASSRPKPEPSITAEHDVAASVTPPPASQAVNETARAPRAMPAQPPKKVPARHAVPHERVVKKAPSLAAEVALLDSARKALDAGDAGQALELLAAYRTSKGRRLTAEATVLRIEALAKAGRTAEASRLAQDFVDRHPASPLVDRARSYVLADPP